MKPYGPLMVEHRLIERFISILKKEAESIKLTGRVHPRIVDSAIVFFREYADNIHHGKEEDMLFAALDGKDISVEHAHILQRLKDEHKAARSLITKLAESEIRYKAGEITEANHIVDFVNEIERLYLAHIRLEDKEFFIPVMQYFSEEEQADLTRRGEEYDSRFDKKKYASLVDDFVDNLVDNLVDGLESSKS